MIVTDSSRLYQQERTVNFFYIILIAVYTSLYKGSRVKLGLSTFQNKIPQTDMQLKKIAYFNKYKILSHEIQTRIIHNKLTYCGTLKQFATFK